MYIYDVTYTYTPMVQPNAFGESFVQSQISIDYLVLYASFATFRRKKTN